MSYTVKANHELKFIEVFHHGGLVTGIQVREARKESVAWLCAGRSETPI